MSISDEISSRVQQGLLFSIDPPNTMYPVRRKMYVTPEIYQRLESPESDEEARIDDFRADLMTFVSDPYVTPKQIWRLDSNRHAGVWEIRSYEAEPQLRLFGQFAARNTFIGMTLKWRDELNESWSIEINKVRHIWRQLFPGRDPLTTSLIHRLFDGGLDEKYFR